MKRLLLLALAIPFFSGCMSLMPQYSLSSFDIDLTQFEKEGIFVTTGDYTKSDYQTISILVADCDPGYQKKAPVGKQASKQTKIIEDNVYGGSPVNLGNYQYRTCLYGDLLDELIYMAKEKGANGLIKLVIRNTSRLAPDGKNYIHGLQLEGLAIKISQ